MFWWGGGWGWGGWGGGGGLLFGWGGRGWENTGEGSGTPATNVTGGEAAAGELPLLRLDPTELVSWWPFWAGVAVAVVALFAGGKLAANLLRRDRSPALPATARVQTPVLERRLRILAKMIFSILAIIFAVN